MKRKGFSISIVLYKSTILKDNSHPIKLRITKDRIQKHFALGIKAKPSQWNDEFSLLKKDKRINPDYEANNEFIKNQVSKAKRIIDDFEKQNKEWTLNQFEEAFFNYSHRGKVKDYFEQHINNLKKIGKHGNTKCYENTIHILQLFDRKFHKRVFSEIDIKYVKEFDLFLQTSRKTVYTSKKGNQRIVKREACSGNTRKYYFKALRAILNKAIVDNEASDATYPFGKGKFEVARLSEVTEKRYLPDKYLTKLKTTKFGKPNLEFSRLLFLFSYYAFGISFTDMALLKKESIIRLQDDAYIIYKRIKTSTAKDSRPIKIKLNENLINIINELIKIKEPINDYLIPIVSTKDITGKELYNHIKNRLKTINKNLKTLAIKLNFNGINLTTYVARHSMAMTLQNSNISREVISQIMDHKDMKTTNTYLDSFESSVIDEAAKVL